MVRKVDTLPATMSIVDVVGFFSTMDHHHKSYPVVDSNGKVRGMVSRADILAWTRDPENAEDILGERVDDDNLVFGHAEELVGPVADRMSRAGLGRIAILGAQGHLTGLLARKDILQVRARRITEESDYAIHLRIASRGTS